MKLWHCDWVPSSVADWLNKELEEKGIFGVTYTHTLFSLIHPYFCSHPVPIERSCHQKKLLNTRDLHSIVNSEPIQELDLLLGETDEHVHPDADFPQLTSSSDKKYQLIGSNRTKEEFCWNYIKKCDSPEKAWKLVACHYLQGLSKEKFDFEAIVEKLFYLLHKATKVNQVLGSVADSDLLLKAEEALLKFNNKEIINCRIPKTNDSEIPSLNFSDQEISKGSCGSDTSNILYWPDLLKSCKGNNIWENNCTENHENFIWKSKDYNTLFSTPIGEPNNTGEFSSEMEYSLSKLNCDSLDINEAGNVIPITCREGDMLNVLSPELLIPSSTFVDEDDNLGFGMKGIELEAWEKANNLFPNTINSGDVPIKSSGGRLFERTVSSLSSCNSGQNQSDGNGSHKATPHPIDQLWEYPIVRSTARDDGVNESSNAFYSGHGDRLISSDVLLPATITTNNTDVISSSSDSFHNSNGRITLPAWPPGAGNIDWKTSDSSRNDQNSNNFLDLTSFMNYDSEIVPFMDIMDVHNRNLKNLTSDVNENISTSDLVSSVENQANFEDVNLLSKREDDYLLFSARDISSSDSTDMLCQSLRKFNFHSTEYHNNKSDNSLQDEGFHSQSRSSHSKSPLDLSSRQDDMQPLSLEYLQLKQLDTTGQDIGNLADHLIPIGPSGPSVDLRHSEGSRFSQVVPHGKQLSIFTQLHNSSSTPVMKSDTENSDDFLGKTTMPCEEENLLTSPRTHFKPIKQDSLGENEEKTEDSHPLSGRTSQDTDLVFQRSGSGLLYLESDYISGSPKKYMTFKEQSSMASKAKSALKPVKHLPLLSQLMEPESTFVPKFKLVNNEKFCQTEEANLTKMKNEAEKYSELWSRNNGVDWNEQAESLKQIWSDECNEFTDISERLWNFQPSKSDDFLRWSSQDGQLDWLNGQNTGEVMYEEMIGSNKDLLAEKDNSNSLQKIKFIWNDSGKPNLLSNSKNFPSSLNEFTTETDSEGTSATERFSSISRNIWPDIGNALQDMNSDVSSEKKDDHDFTPKWHLQWGIEAPTEREDFFGSYFSRSSPLKVSSPTNVTTLDESFSTAASTVAEESLSLKVESDKMKFLEFLEREENRQLPLEDLDRLEPGWDLNDGFEWGPQAEQIFRCDEDDESGQEVFVYEREDGETVMLPVEYFDDNLYDQIFGGNDNPIGGSLPDLPGGGQIGRNMKKGHIKISRRSRGSERYSFHSKKPCSFFIEGKCIRTDCKFSHDLSTITCRFWEEGSCFKGDTCPFRHGFVPSRRRNHSEGDQITLADSLTISFGSLKEKSRYSNGSRGKTVPRRNRSSVNSVSSFELDSEADFPCLGSSVESKIGSLDDESIFLSRVKITKKKKSTSSTTTLSSKNCLKGNEFTPVNRDGINGQYEEEEVDAPKIISSKSKKKAKSSNTSNCENGSSSNFKNNNNKKKKKSKEGSDIGECESLKKILKKRFFSVKHNRRFDDVG